MTLIGLKCIQLSNSKGIIYGISLKWLEMLCSEVHSHCKHSLWIAYALSNIFSSKNMNIKIHITIILPVILHICKIRSYSQARTQRKGVREQGTGKNIFGGSGSRRKEKITQSEWREKKWIKSFVQEYRRADISLTRCRWENVKRKRREQSVRILGSFFQDFLQTVYMHLYSFPCVPCASSFSSSLMWLP